MKFLRQQDLVEKFVRSSSPGGQNVNKTATCVYLKHIPTGIEVKCKSQRSQGQNRRLARQILLAKIRRKMAQEAMQEEKFKRAALLRKRKRTALQKARILEDKRRRSQKKFLRRKIRDIEE